MIGFLLHIYALMELVEERQELLEKVEVMWVDSGYNGDKFGLAVWLMIQAQVEVKFAKKNNLRFYPNVG